MRALTTLSLTCLLLSLAPAAKAEPTFTKKARVVVDAETGRVLSSSRAEAGLTYAPPKKPAQFSHKYECKRLDIFTRPWPDGTTGGGIATKGACDANSTSTYAKWPAPAAFQVVKTTKRRAQTACKKKLESIKPGSKVKRVQIETYFPAKIELTYTFVKTSGPGMRSHRIKRDHRIVVPTIVTCRIPAKAAEPKRPRSPSQPRPPVVPRPSKPRG